MFNSSPDSERRLAPRVRLTVRVQLFHKGVEIQAYSTDISTTGIFIETPHPLRVGSVVLLGFSLGTGARKTIQAEGRVVQVRGPDEAAANGVMPGMGIMFQGFLFGKSDLAGELSQRLDTLRGAKRGAVQDPARHPRFLVGFPVLWGTKPPPVQIGFITDIGADGAFVITENPQLPGSHLYLSFDVPTSGLPQRVRAVAQVRKANFPDNAEEDEPIGMGITFDEASLEDPSVLPFMEQHLQRQRHTLLQETAQQEGPMPDLPDLSSFLRETEVVEHVPAIEAGLPTPAYSQRERSPEPLEELPRIEVAPELNLAAPGLSWRDTTPSAATLNLGETSPVLSAPAPAAAFRPPDPPVAAPAPAPLDSAVAWVNPAVSTLGAPAAAGVVPAGAEADAAELASVFVSPPPPPPPPEPAPSPSPVPYRRSPPVRTPDAPRQRRVGRWVAAIGVLLLALCVLFVLHALRA